MLKNTHHFQWNECDFTVEDFCSCVADGVRVVVYEQGAYPWREEPIVVIDRPTAVVDFAFDFLDYVVGDFMVLPNEVRIWICHD